MHTCYHHSKNPGQNPVTLGWFKYRPSQTLNRAFSHVTCYDKITGWKLIPTTYNVVRRGDPEIFLEMTGFTSDKAIEKNVRYRECRVVMDLIGNLQSGDFELH